MQQLTDRFRPVVGPVSERPASPFQAFDRILRRPCMVKFASVRSAGVEDLRAEGRLLAELEHPGLVDLLGEFDEATVPWSSDPVAGLVTGWVDGDPFVEGLASANLDERIAAFLELAGVVAYLHRCGVLHLDLKPDNALWAGDRVVLLDLGSARPLDVGPGQAGGTLGYASPEVLAGQAASVGSDIYSLGVILYQLLVGAPPHGPLDGQDLRRATLSGEVVNPRLVSREVSRDHARLLMDMLALQVSGRPGSLAEVVERLSPASTPASMRLGLPPFVGRVDECAQLTSLLEQPGGRRIDLVGPPGSGRTRLVRRVLSSKGLSARLGTLDLSGVAAPMRAIDALLNLTGNSLPDLAQTTAWQRKAQELLADDAQDRVLFLGRREQRRPDELLRLDSLEVSLVEAGARVIWACTESDQPEAHQISLGGLELEATSRLAQFYGISSSAVVRELRSRTGSWPAGLVQQLQPRTISPRRGPGDGIDGLVALLPAGVSALARSLLPPILQQRLSELEADGRAAVAADGRLYVSQALEAPAADPQLTAALLDGIEAVGLDQEPLWFGLLAARLGRVPLALERFAEARSGGQREDYLELCERLSSAGHRPATRALADLLVEDGALDAAEALLRGLEDRSADEDLQLLRVLSFAGRREAALEVCDDLLKRGPSVELWTRRANLLVELGHLEEAEDACVQAAEVAGGWNHPRIIFAGIKAALARLDSQQEPRAIDQLVAQIEASRREGTLTSGTLSAAGRLYSRLGRLAEGARILDEAAGLADQENQRVAAAGIRLNAGGAWLRLGKGNEARQRFEVALDIALEIGNQKLEVRLRYSLAELELRSGRLPDAERHISAFEELTRTVSLPGAAARHADLQARWLLAKGRPKAALEVIEGIDEKMPTDLEASVGLHKAMALLELELPEQALPVLEGLPRTSNEAQTALAATLEGRAHIAIGRSRLAGARRLVPDKVDPMVVEEYGSVLLGAAGEDLDPASFRGRREDLDRAASMLRDEQAARAATLRDRLLDGPGAALEGIVALTETMHDPKAFPEAMARLVSEALGAYRVLIMVRIPGLGQQVSYTELSGAEAAGISGEVLGRIREPDDYWLAHNAFADPRLRASSQTVKTFKLKSLLAVAIPHGDKAVGALYVDDLHRANRFGDEDIAMLRRLAKAIGRALPLLSASGRRPVLEEPTDMFGVLLSDEKRIDDMDYAVSMLEGQDQTNLLVTGPTGAGKSIFAERIATEVLELNGVVRAVLRQGDPDKLISNLMGTRKGEFTSAVERSGAIERCLKEGKALFLDEVQNLDEAGQHILLPLLELPQRHVANLTGATERLRQPLHVILGTNADVDRGGWREFFREDLWYRMNQVRVHLPSLAERGPEAVYRYLADMLAKRGVGPPEQVFETSALHRVTHWSWPGNFRRLETFTQRAAHLHKTQKRVVRVDDLVRLELVDEGEGELTNMAQVSLEQVQVEHVLSILAKHGWVQLPAARELGMTAPTLSRFLRRHGLSKDVSENRRQSRAALANK